VTEQLAIGLTDTAAGGEARWCHRVTRRRAAWKYALALATLGCTVLAGTLGTLILVELGKGALERLLILLRVLGNGLLLA